MRYTLRADEIQNVDDDASVFIKDEEGERTTSLIGQTFTYDRRDVAISAVRRLLSALRPGSGRPWPSTTASSARSSRRVLLSHHPRRGGQSSAARRRLHPRHTRRGRAPVEPLLHRRRPTCAASSSAALARAIRRPTTGWAAISTMSGQPRCASRSACPRSCASSGAASSMPATLSDIDVSGPTLDESDGLRVAAGVGLSWLSPARALVDRLRAGAQEGGEGRDRVLPTVLRHPVLMRRGCSRRLLTVGLRGWRSSCSGSRPSRRREQAAAGGGRGDRLPAHPARRASAARPIRDQVEARRQLYQDEIAKEEQRLHEVDKELAAQRSDAVGRGVR